MAPSTTQPSAADQSNASRTSASRARKRRLARTVTAVAVVAALGGGTWAYAAAAAARPLPGPEISLTAPDALAAAGDSAQAVVDSWDEPTAIGWYGSHEEGTSDEVWTNDENAYALASVSKLITVLVAQEKRPIELGSDGVTIVWSEEDAEAQRQYLADDGVAYPIPVGTEVTERQMLTFIFLPSANDYARAYARSVFGTDEAFLEAVASWTKRNGLDSIQFVEPTGMDEGNKASAADLVRVARIALDNPAILEFTGTKRATMPWGVGEIENTNPLLGVLPGIVGLKTGRSSVAGFNFIAVQRTDASGREVTGISVTLGRGSPEQRADHGAAVLGQIAKLPLERELVAEGAHLGTAQWPFGPSAPVTAAASASAVMLPGEVADFSVTQFESDEAGTAAAEADGAGPLEVGSLTVQAPGGEQIVPLVAPGAPKDPGLWWRMTHPGLLWG